MVYEVQCSLRGIEEETDRREGKGRHYCSGDVLECRTRNLQQGWFEGWEGGGLVWCEPHDHPFFWSFHSSKWLKFRKKCKLLISVFVNFYDYSSGRLVWVQHHLLTGRGAGGDSGDPGGVHRGGRRHCAICLHQSHCQVWACTGEVGGTAPFASTNHITRFELTLGRSAAPPHCTMQWGPHIATIMKCFEASAVGFVWLL